MCQLLIILSRLISSHHQLNHRWSPKLGPRPLAPLPEVEVRPASISTRMNYNNKASNGLNSVCSKHSQIPYRRNNNITAGSSHINTGGRRSGPTRDTNNFVSQFNSNNNAVMMVPLPNTTSIMLQARASMNSAGIAKEKAVALQMFPRVTSSRFWTILGCRPDWRRLRPGLEIATLLIRHFWTATINPSVSSANGSLTNTAQR